MKSLSWRLITGTLTTRKKNLERVWSGLQPKKKSKNAILCGHHVNTFAGISASKMTKKIMKGNSCCCQEKGKEQQHNFLSSF
jgi:hypothetical protein